ncbi:hypothetical protein PMSD_27695 [Paenibacillus macquariensis subsp. defensor]|nr:hypothetical protein PMSD_27695 [Paenibacillus macquariensis subsp. defensor]
MTTWLWTFNYIRKVKGVYLAALLLLIISVVTNLSIIYAQKLIIDKIFIGHRYDLFPSLILFFAVIVCTYIASWCFKDILFERASDKIRLLMRRDYMTYLYKMPMKNFQKERTGSLVSYLNEFINSKNAYIWNLPALFEKSLNLLLLLGIIGWVMPKFLLIIFPLSVLYIIQGRYFSRRMNPISVDKNEAMAVHQIAIEEGIASTREVIAFHQADWEKNKIKDTFNRYLMKLLQAGRLERTQLAIAEPMRWAANLTILGFGGYEVIRGEISIGLFVVFYQYAIQMIDSIHGVYQSFLDFSSSYGGLHKAKCLIEGERIKDTESPLIRKIDDIHFHDVTFTYTSERQLPILNKLSFTIPAGKKVALVGDSGSGKSTIAQLLVRFHEPEQGSIHIGDTNLEEISRESWASKIAVVFQDPYLFPDSIRNNLLIGRAYSDAEMVEACQLAEIHDYIMELPQGYDTILGERGITLSGGQRQRIAIAKAIIGHPELLILDEATSALDPETERKIHRNLDTNRSAMTSLIIAHRLSTIENADLIYVMSNGSIMDCGTHSELMNRLGRYSELFQANAS